MKLQKWAAGIAAGGLAGAAGVYYGVTDLMIRMAFDRKMPLVARGFSRRVSGTERLEEVRQMQKRAAGVLRESGCTRVSIRGRDGVELVGHLSRCEGARRLILAFHGWRSSWASDFGLIAPFWEREKCRVLYAEQRGQNESGGDCMGFGLLERYDALAWAKWAQERFALPVYLSGISMGATTVLMAAGLELPPCVHGILADCGFTSPHAIWKHISQENLRISYSRQRQLLAEYLCRKKLHMGGETYSTVEAMKNCRVPVLFVHGAEDHFVPVEMTVENYRACAAPKALRIVPGADHGMSYLTDREGCEKAMVDFWETWDFSTAP